MSGKICELDERKICDDCKKCLFCDIDPVKYCDNCCECLDDADYRAIKILDIITDEEKARKYKL